MLVLSTLGAPERRRFRGRKGLTVREPSPEPVPTNRVTVVRAEPFPTPGHAESWLAAVRDDPERRESELAQALAVLNRALHAHRAARADARARDVGIAQAHVTRIGFGSGDEVAMGLFDEAWELPKDGPKVKRSMEAPEERFAALLGGREQLLACEELVLRARLDLDNGRPREAALQARIALEALLAEITQMPGDRRPGLEADRGPIGAAANAALQGELPDDLSEAVSSSIERMESALRARRLDSAV